MPWKFTPKNGIGVTPIASASLSNPEALLSDPSLSMALSCLITGFTLPLFKARRSAKAVPLNKEARPWFLLSWPWEYTDLETSIVPLLLRLLAMCAPRSKIFRLVILDKAMLAHDPLFAEPCIEARCEGSKICSLSSELPVSCSTDACATSELSRSPLLLLCSDTSATEYS